MEESSMRMNLESLSKQALSGAYGVFALIVIVFAIVGAFGPDLLSEISVSASKCPEGVTDKALCEGVDMAAGETWEGAMVAMSHFNQEIRIIMSVVNGNEDVEEVKSVHEISLDVEGKMTGEDEWQKVANHATHQRTISCESGNTLCSNVTLVHIPFIHYNDYRFFVTIDTGNTEYIQDVYFTYITVQAAFTEYELAWRATFMFASVFILILWTARLRRFEWRERTFEQKWTTALLWNLILYNNPFFPLRILTDNAFWELVDVVTRLTFVWGLFLYWFIVLDGLRKGNEQREYWKFYAPKFLIVGFLWVIGVIASMWERTAQLDDPEMNITDVPGWQRVATVLRVASFVLLAWFFLIFFRVNREARAHAHLTARARVLWNTTAIVIVLIVFGISANASGVRVNSAEVVGFTALYNAYVWTLAYLYSPSKESLYSKENAEDGALAFAPGMIRLDDDSSDEEEAAFTNTKL